MRVVPSVPVDHVGVTKEHRIEPPTATLSLCGDANFSASLLQVVASLVGELSGKWTVADARAVRLGDTVNFANVLRRNAQTSACTADSAVGRCHKGVRAKVNVEHSRIGALNENLLALANGAIEERHGVRDAGTNFVGKCLVLGKLRVNVNCQVLVLTAEGG